MSQKLPVGAIEWVLSKSLFNKDFIKNYYEILMKDIFLKSVFNILKCCVTFTIFYSFYWKE